MLEAPEKGQFMEWEQLYLYEETHFIAQYYQILWYYFLSVDHIKRLLIKDKKFKKPFEYVESNG